MNQATITGEKFSIELRGKTYDCTPIEMNGRILYKVNFNNSYLCMTMAMDSKGTSFWTSVPADSKLNHIVLELGQQIENRLM